MTIVRVVENVNALLRWILIPTPPMGLSLKDAGSFDEEDPIIQLDGALNGQVSTTQLRANVKP